MFEKFVNYFIEKRNLEEFGFTQLKWRGSQVLRYCRKIGDKEYILRLTLFDVSFDIKGVYLSYEYIGHGVIFPSIVEIFERANVEDLKKDWYNEKDFFNGNKILSSNHPNWKRPFNKYPRISENLLDKNGELDEQKTDEAITILKNIIENQVLPFYDLYPDLQSVNDTIIDVYDTTRELSDYISGMIGFKKMTIMGLCNNHKYNNYIEQYESKLVKGVEKDHEKYAPYLAFFRNLKKVLSKNDDAPKVLE